MIIILIFYFKQLLCVQPILKASVNPIIQIISNKDQITQFNFNFLLSDDLNEEGYIQINFPQQFIGAFSNQSYCSEECQFENNYVKVYFKKQLYTLQDYIIILYNIKNPSLKSGTSNFSLQAKIGNNLVQENKIFGSLGIWSQIEQLNSANIAFDKGYGNAGDFSLFNFSFKIPQQILGSVQVVIELPQDTFQVSQYPSCQTYSINGYQRDEKIQCQYIQQRIYVNGFDFGIDKGSIIGIQIRMGNPSYSIVTNQFSIFIYKKNTNLAYFQKKNISGLLISPGQISQLLFTQKSSLDLLTLNKILWCQLSFKLQNGLSEQSKIQIKFPREIKIIDQPNYILYKPWSYYLQTGLEDYDNETKLTIIKSTVNEEDYLEVKNFKPIESSNNIVFYILLQLPSISGKTSSLEITSFNKDNSIIDQDKENAYMIIRDIPQPQVFDIQILTQLIDDISYKQMEITIKPSVNLSIGFVLKIEFSNDLQLERIVQDDCEIYNDSTQQWEQLGTCQTQDNSQLLYFDKEIKLGIQKKIRINKSFLPPSFNGNLLFNGYFYENKQMKNLVQAYTQLVQFNEQKFTEFHTNIYPRYYDQRSILDINFQFADILDVSPLLNDPSQLVSYIVLEFKFTDQNFVDFGQGIQSGQSKIISCKSVKGLIAYSNSQIICEFFAQPNPYIVIKNYKRIQKNENVQILIPNLLNPNDIWTLRVSCAIEKKRVRKILAYEEVQIDTTLALPNGMVSDMNDNSETFYNVSNKKINQYFDIKFLISDSTTIENDSKIIIQLPSYANGFLTQENIVICSLLNIYFKCHHFKDINWIYILIDQMLSPIANKSYIFLGNLLWPYYQIQNFPNNKNIFRFINNQGLITKIINYPYFPRPIIGEFTMTKIQIDKREKENVDCKYIFKFKTNVQIPLNSELQLDFPEVYNLWAPNPAIEINSSDLQQLSIDNILDFQYTNQQFKIKNLPQISQDQQINIEVTGIRNPNFSQSLQNWYIKIHQDGNLIAEKQNFENFLLFDEFIPRRIDIESISIFPKNQNIIASYIFKFYLQTQIKKNSIIQIEFPKEFEYISNSLTYQISGGIKNILKVNKIERKILFYINEKSQPGLIEIQINNIRNPIINKTSEFYICTKQDSKVLDETKEDSKDKLTLIFNEQPTDLQVLQFEFCPRTETYSSEYQFTIKPIFDIESNEKIIIIFPDTFDITIGSNVYIITQEGLEGNIKLEINNRKIYIYNQFFYDSQKNDQIRFILRGIENPSQNQSNDQGYISIGIIKQNMQEYKEYQEQAGKVEIYTQAKPLNLVSFELSNYYSRFQAIIKIIIRLDLMLEQDQYTLHVVLPIQYQLKYQEENLKCKVNHKEESCIHKYDEIIIQLNQSLIQDVIIEIDSIKNPEDELTCDHFKVFILLKESQNSILQTFNNLHDLKFDFKFPGPRIIINNDEPIFIEKGSYSNYLNVRMTEISALNLKISTKNQKVKILPEKIELNIGDIEKQVKISVSSQVTEDLLMFDWDIQGDLDQPIYTPVKKTFLQLTNKKNLPLKFQQIPEIPIDGSSLGIEISTPFGPEIGINIELVLNINNQYVYLNTTEVNFSPGQTKNYFEIFAEENSQIESKQGSIEMLLKGPNQDRYILNTNRLTFALGPQDNRKPEILEIKILEKSKVHAIINFIANEYAVGYYMNVLKNSIVPTFNEVESQYRFDCDTIRCQFGIVHLDQNYQANIKIDNLEAQTEYTLYVFLKDRGGNIIQIPANIDYITDNKHNAAIAKIFFNQNFINSVEKQMILSYMAFLMSLEQYKVIESQYDFYNDIYDIEITNQMTYLTFDILTEIKSSVYPSPLNLSQILNQKNENLKNKFPNFNKNIFIHAQEFVQYELNFTTNPVIENIGDDFVTVIIKLDNYGWVYAVAITKSEDIGQPTSFQVSKGFNSFNLKRSSAYKKIDKKFTNFIIKIDQLQQNTDYKLYLSTGSAHPGYPDLLNDDSIQTLIFKTLKKQQQPTLSLEYLSIFNTITIVIILCILVNQFKYFIQTIKISFVFY